ncbi:MAG: hypothetical protein JNN20_09305 [Betaproteobacteria bacterium]|nr:hypothetical protein [Betaproteobacteria bacterium]
MPIKIDDAWAHIYVSVLIYLGFVGIGIAVVGGVMGVQYSVEIGSGIFLVSRLCLGAVNTPKPIDRGEEAGSDDQVPERPVLKAKKIRRKV